MLDTARFLLLAVVSTRAFRETSLSPRGAALPGGKVVRVRSSRSVGAPELSEAFQSMNRENNHLVLRNFYLSFGSVM